MNFFVSSLIHKILLRLEKPETAISLRRKEGFQQLVMISVQFTTSEERHEPYKIKSRQTKFYIQTWLLHSIEIIYY